ncbi:hypothetical protein [Absidia glauca]|uniref:Uncharacterized protein n=1 Tax=Absidia glauca TaxID=4829 RepID=A0A163KDJ3_ABSGL|nr:hypothetical protein [Absidia glauca]
MKCSLRYIYFIVFSLYWLTSCAINDDSSAHLQRREPTENEDTSPTPTPTTTNTVNPPTNTHIIPSTTTNSNATNGTHTPLVPLEPGKPFHYNESVINRTATANIDYLLSCKVDDPFCTKVENGIKMALSEFAKVVDIKSKIMQVATQITGTLVFQG